ncbi:MAG: hypothetical protein LBD94_01895 [Rickettsiales bacterium]|jgi:hypothetical protein|nr:hypothetical protein [Rickettsiales bacterium]
MQKSNIVAFVAAAMLAIAISYFFFGRKDKEAVKIAPTKTQAEHVQKTKVKTSQGFGNYKFDDGLHGPDSKTEFPLNDAGEGVASSETFNANIGGGKKIRINRIKNESQTSHSYFEYKIELETNGNFADITPDEFRTVEGADCALQKIRFVFTPEFAAIKISRKWIESWITPTMATKTIYKLSGDKLEISSSVPLEKICNVSDLF